MEAVAGNDPMIFSMAALAVSLVAIILLLVLWARQRTLLKRYRLLLNGTSEQDLETLLLLQGARLESTQREVAALSTQVATLAQDAQLHVQKVATVRYNAFPDTGSDLSFAIALLDSHNDGLVLSSLYGRSESRIYAKPIQGGTSTYILSDEEKQALGKAMGRAEEKARSREKETSNVG